VLPGKPMPLYRDLFSGMHTTSRTQSNKLENYKHGTTTLGFVFKDGVIFAVDSRASMGSFVSSE
jgi:20S proteasome subunit beta 5